MRTRSKNVSIDPQKDTPVLVNNERQSRFKGLIPVLNTMNALVVGCGSLGSHLIAMLSRMCPEAIYVIDHDKVEVSNLGVQDFTSDDVGYEKADIIANKYGAGRTIILPYVMRFEAFASDLLANRIKSLTHIFMCVDTMETRKHIFNSLMDVSYSGLIVDGRLDSNVGWVYAARKQLTRGWFGTTLYSDAEVITTGPRCAIQMTGYSAHGIAALMIGQAMRFSQDDSLINERIGFDYNHMLFFPAEE